jgi:hypothetical protein
MEMVTNTDAVTDQRCNSGGLKEAGIKEAVCSSRETMPASLVTGQRLSVHYGRPAQGCRRALPADAPDSSKRLPSSKGGREGHCCGNNLQANRVLGSSPGTRANEAPGPSLLTPRTSKCPRPCGRNSTKRGVKR